MEGGVRFSAHAPPQGRHRFLCPVSNMMGLTPEPVLPHKASRDAKVNEAVKLLVGAILLLLASSSVCRKSDVCSLPPCALFLNAFFPQACHG